MRELIHNLLQDKGGNYILPFFWQHGESEEVLREYMGAIHGCGIGAVCVEARPHPDYVGPRWWHDMDIILEEAKNRNMKVWILDDAHFPTGYAAGKMEEAAPELCKQFIDYNKADVCGSMPQALLNVERMAHTIPNPMAGGMAAYFMGGKEPRHFDDDQLLAVIASRIDSGDHLDDTLLDLTNNVQDGMLEWDVPNGMWRIFVLYQTRNGGARTDYINMLDEASCRVQIEAVYEPHWEHYKDEFGKTIAGFFSDEPAIGNTVGFSMDESIGRKKMPLPWSKHMPGMMEEALGQDYIRFLPALWTGVGAEELTAKVRYAYMDSVTRLVDRCFASQIGTWCEEHGVEYIGHIIEDNNQHSRLGSSQGHYFRAMYGQHMSGIDDIGNQVLLGGENHNRTGIFGVPGDGGFYHFALGKLGSSFAHIDPKKKGRAMCEIFGAYGWEFGVREMKYVLDHFLVRGINMYVPHAFSPKEFPDPDCPPHFYAHGENPQYRHFGKLMHYMNRSCEMLSGGRNVAPIAVLYHGEAEWSGDYMFLQEPARELLEHQIDFDIIPSDVFENPTYFKADLEEVSDEKPFKVNQTEYQALVVPYAQFVTEKVAEFAGRAAKHGFPVIFVDGLPEGICNLAQGLAERLSDEEHNKWQTAREVELMEALEICQVVFLEDLAVSLKEQHLNEISCNTKFDRLRYYHYVKNGTHMYLFNNEDPGIAFDGQVTVPEKGAVSLYDAMENLVYPAFASECEEGTRLHVHLEPYQTELYVFADLSEWETKKACPAGGQWKPVKATWKLSFAQNKEYPNFHDEETLTELTNVGKKHPTFSGFMRYETEFQLEKMGESQTLLNIENAYEGVEVWVNEQYAGMRICPPYTFDLSKFAKVGTNSLRIEVANTLANKVTAMNTEGIGGMRMGPSVVAPSGMIGKVSIVTK